MTARISQVYQRNFPVLPMKLSEGVLTRSSTVIGPDGGTLEGTVSYAAQLKKGDRIIMDAANTDKGELVCTAATVSATGLLHGIIVSDPKGEDATTVSGQTPVLAYKRRADVMIFGLGVFESLVNETVVPGDVLCPDASDAQNFAKDTGAASATVASNGGLMSLTYAASGEKAAVLVGAYFACAD